MRSASVASCWRQPSHIRVLLHQLPTLTIVIVFVIVIFIVIVGDNRATFGFSCIRSTFITCFIYQLVTTFVLPKMAHFESIGRLFHFQKKGKFQESLISHLIKVWFLTWSTCCFPCSSFLQYSETMLLFISFTSYSNYHSNKSSPSESLHP